MSVIAESYSDQSIESLLFLSAHHDCDSILVHKSGDALLTESKDI